MKTILVTGANGYLASYIQQKNHHAFQWIRMTRKDADLTDPGAVSAFLETQDFDLCFHTAANATTAWCNKHSDLAHTINVESTQKIIEACRKKQATLIFSSTEQCFNGKTEQGPFDEDELVKAVTVYGQNKIECEQLIHQQLPKAIILRYSWQMGLSFPDIKASPNIIGNVMHALLYQEPAKFTCNERRCMTYARHLAEQFQQITQLTPGTYHVAAQNDMTTYESAVYVAQQLGAKPEAIQRYILPDTKRYAERFRDYRLDSCKLAKQGITFGTFKENVDEVLKDFGWRK